MNEETKKAENEVLDSEEDQPSSSKVRKILKILFHILSFVVLLILSIWFDRYPFGIFFPFIGGVSDFLTYVLVLYVVLLAMWIGKDWLIPSNSLTSSELQSDVIETQVNQILESNEFRTSIKNALPKVDGKQDAIWEMLRSMIVLIDKRKEHFDYEYKKFLRWTQITGICLVIAFFGMSYYFLSEASTGAEKSVVEIEKTSKELNDSLNSLESNSIRNDLNSILFSIRQEITTQKLDYSRDSFVRDISKQIIFNPTNLKEIGELKKMLSEKEPEVEQNQNINPNFKQKYRTALSDLNDYYDKELKTFDKIPDLITRIDAVNKKADETFDKPENRIPEVIKRLFITIGVITFFIAILRFCVKLYRENFMQAAIAEQDHMLCKKFFLSYNLAKSEDSKKQILEGFLLFSNLSEYAKTKDEKDEETLKSLELFKDLISSFKK